MFKKITIKETSPRDLSSINVAFSKGLHLKRFFGYFFLLGAAMLFLISVLMFKMVVPAIMFAILSGVGYYMVNNVNKTVNIRKEIYNKGDIVRAKVESHDRKFNPLKSNKDYIVTVRPNNKQSNLHTIKSTSNHLWGVLPIGSEIIGLYYNGDYFFGEELVCQFTLI